MKKDKLHIILLIIAILMMVTSWVALFCKKTQPSVIKTDTVTITDTMWKDTTIIEKEFVPKEVIKKKVDTIYLENGDTLNLITESKRYERSLVSHKDTFFIHRNEIISIKFKRTLIFACAVLRF